MNGEVSDDGFRSEAPDPVALADLTRVAEPGDKVLASAVRKLGVEEVRRLLEAPPAVAVGTLFDAVREFGVVRAAGDVGQALRRWRARLPELDGARDLRVMDRVGARLLGPKDEEWPIGLTDLGIEAPIGLWVRGPGDAAALCARSIALVGARAASSYGETVTKNFGFELVRHGYTVLSGGAYGIDAAAHMSALAGSDGIGTGTVAFMAGGVDKFYPAGNSELLSRIADRHLLVSETAPGTTPMKHRFLARNRLIAAAASTTVVVEAGYRSGALNTAHHAAELLRPLGAVPGPVTNATSAGCHVLLREGAAVCVTNVEEILELAGPLDPGGIEEDEGLDALTPEERKVLNALPRRRGAQAVNLAIRIGSDTSSTSAALASLELAGLVRRAERGWVKI